MNSYSITKLPTLPNYITLYKELSSEIIALSSYFQTSFCSILGLKDPRKLFH